MRDKDLSPGKPDAWMRGCPCSQKDAEHKLGCIFYVKPVKAVPNVVKQVSGSPVGWGGFTGGTLGKAAPVGLRYMKTTLSQLALGDLYIPDHDYQNYCAGTSPGWPRCINPSLIIGMRMSATVNGIIDCWKVEFIY